LILLNCGKAYRALITWFRANLSEGLGRLEILVLLGIVEWLSYTPSGGNGSNSGIFASLKTLVVLNWWELWNFFDFLESMEGLEFLGILRRLRRLGRNRYINSMIDGNNTRVGNNNTNKI
jgi:hypothetical protein